MRELSKSCGRPTAQVRELSKSCGRPTALFDQANAMPTQQTGFAGRPKSRLTARPTVAPSGGQAAHFPPAFQNSTSFSLKRFVLAAHFLKTMPKSTTYETYA